MEEDDVFKRPWCGVRKRKVASSCSKMFPLAARRLRKALRTATFKWLRRCFPITFGFSLTLLSPTRAKCAGWFTMTASNRMSLSSSRDGLSGMPDARSHSPWTICVFTIASSSRSGSLGTVKSSNWHSCHATAQNTTPTTT